MAKEILIADSDKADQEEFQKIFETNTCLDHIVFYLNLLKMLPLNLYS